MLFEHGLAQGEKQEHALRECAERLATAGMDGGAELVNALCGELARSRVDGRWEPEEASAVYARLWKYAGLCLRRLEYLEAEAQLVEGRVQKNIPST